MKIDVGRYGKSSQYNLKGRLRYKNGYNEMPMNHFVTLCRLFNVSASMVFSLNDDIDV